MDLFLTERIDVTAVFCARPAYVPTLHVSSLHNLQEAVAILDRPLSVPLSRDCYLD